MARWMDVRADGRPYVCIYVSVTAHKQSLLVKLSVIGRFLLRSGVITIICIITTFVKFESDHYMWLMLGGDRSWRLLLLLLLLLLIKI